MSSIRSCPKTEGVRPQAEGKSLRGIQHRSSGSGLVIRVVYLVGLPGGTNFFLFAHIPMALTKAEKTAQLQVLKEKMQKSSSIIFTHYTGLTVLEVSDLRQKLRDNKAEMKVAKKTLMRLAAEELQLPALQDDLMDGPVACIFSYEDPMAGAQTTFTYAKTHPKVELIGGMFDGKILTKSQAMAFATMPNRQQLLGIFAGMLQSPLRSFASMCNAPLTGFARAISELSKQKSAA